MFYLLSSSPILSSNPFLPVGIRGCRSVLILAELKLIIGAIYTNHATKIVEAPDIEQVDEYTGGPKGNKVILEFQRA